MGEMFSINTLDNAATFNAYCARPTMTPKAGIIVIQEIFGVNEGIRQKCDNWAALGYIALAPDLFWRSKQGIELDADIPEQMQEAFGYMQAFDVDDGIKDIESCIRTARALVGGGKVGAVGYCLGGKIAYMLSCRTDIDASIGYYGVMIDQMLNESHAIARPLMLHIPTADHYVRPGAQAEIHAGLDAHLRVTLHDYEGLDHGFAAETGTRRHEAGAQLADGRTVAFFEEYLA